MPFFNTIVKIKHKPLNLKCDFTHILRLKKTVSPTVYIDILSKAAFLALK